MVIWHSVNNHPSTRQTSIVFILLRSLFISMKFSIVAASLVTLAAAAPQTSYYDASHPPVIFKDTTCTLSRYLTPGQPLSFAYPSSNFFGSLLTPVLDTLIGPETVEDIDRVADQLCL